MHCPVRIRLLAANVVLALSALLPAQDLQLVGTHTGAGVPGGAASFATPVHRGPEARGANQDVGGDGVWVAGADFKASFHDGFVFYPLLGAGYPHNLPLRWTTAAVTLGGQRVGGLHPGPVMRHGSRRVEFDHGAFREVYDVRPDGVEQTFVFDRPLGGGGDLVVVGHVDSELLCGDAPERCQALEFADASGLGIVRYGAAVAVDARGRRQAVTTARHGARVELRVDAAFLAEAQYPICIDPLIARINLQTGVAPVEEVDMVVAPDVGAPKLMVVYSRVFAANDLDTYAVVAGTDFSSPVTVFSDVNASWSTKHGRCTYVGDGHRWALVFERELFAPTTSSVVTYFHQRDNAVLNSGAAVTLSKPAGTTARFPDIGGRRPGGGWYVLVVYQTDITATQQNTTNTETWGVVVDAGTATEASIPNTLDWFEAGITYDRERPTVVKLSDGTFGYWIVSWQEYFPLAVPDDWDINVTRLDYAGHHQAQRYRLGASVAPPHKRHPQIAGGDGRFLMVNTFGQSQATEMADEIHVQRFDWPDNQYDLTMGLPIVLVADAQQPNFAFPRLAYDGNTRSHWAIAYQRGLTSGGDLFVHRVGPDGSSLEARTLFQSAAAVGGATAVGFAPANGGSFPIVYTTSEPGLPLFATALQYPAGATNVAYGTGCGGTIAAPPPYVGSEFFAITLAGAEPNQLAVLAVSTDQAALPFFWLPNGCSLLIGDGGLLPVVTSASGAAAVQIPLRTSLPAGLTVFSQWLHVQSSGVPAYVLATGGLRSRIE